MPPPGEDGSRAQGEDHMNIDRVNHIIEVGIKQDGGTAAEEASRRIIKGIEKHFTRKQIARVIFGAMIPTGGRTNE